MRRVRRAVVGLTLIALAGTASAGLAQAPRVEELSLSDAAAALAAGTSSEALVRAYLARIEALDRKGPALRSVIALCRERANGRRAGGSALGLLG
jgi:amidase